MVRLASANNAKVHAYEADRTPPPQDYIFLMFFCMPFSAFVWHDVCIAAEAMPPCEF